MRVLSSGCAAWLLLLSACGANPAAPGSTTAGAGAGGAAAGGAPAGAAGAAGGPLVGGGAPSGGATSSAGAGGVGTAGAPIALAGAGGGDNGGLFDPSSSVPFDPNAGGAGGAVGTGGSGGLNIDGKSVTSSISGKVNGTATFVQSGVDVKVTVKFTSCPSGVLGIHINDGDSCDNAGTEGKPWDGKRGNIGDTGTITCSNNSASLTYTRLGSDPATNWTIGDHNLKTDITSYVVIVSTNADGTSQSSFIGCGNFFK